MPLVSLKDVLDPAVEKNYAVGAFNVSNHLLFEAVINAAEAKNKSVIINLAEVHFKYLDLENFIPYLKNRINNSKIPLVLHLDHGLSFETVMKAIHWGFSSVMIDASSKALKENIKITKKVVEAAHAAGVSVEAELGHVAGGEGDIKNGTEVDKNSYTRVEDASYFVKETGIDALAVAVGTVHGLYQGEPELDLERLKKIRSELDIPLVLHGGSGLTDQDFKDAVNNGINKINFYTGNSLLGVEAIKDHLEKENGITALPDLSNAAYEKMKKNVEKYIGLFANNNL